jgi:sialate O-acetylesterase
MTFAPYLGWGAALGLVLASSGARAEITLPGIFGDGMVLPRDTEIPIWGKATPGASIQVRAPWGYSPMVSADAEGQWRTALPATAAGGPYELHVTGDGEKVIRDVGVGVVFLAVGQSNMAKTLEPVAGQVDVPNWQADVAQSADPLLRFARVPRGQSERPLMDVNVRWSAAQPNTVGPVSAVAYYFGRRLRESLKVPVGVIVAARGATLLDEWRPLAMNNHFNAMVAPLTGFRLSGVLLYQGESDAARPEGYGDRLKGFAREYRQAFGDPNLWIGLVQIAPHAYRGARRGNAPLIREAQRRMALEDARIGLVNPADLVDDVQDIHPPRKREVGERLAQLFVAMLTPGSGGPFGPPLLLRATFGEGEAQLEFRPGGPGLRLSPGEEGLFELSADGKAWFPAESRLVEGKVALRSREVGAPKFARYAWRDAFRPVLFGPDGSPASSFTTVP